MKKIVTFLVFVLVLMEGVSWWVNRSLPSKDTDRDETSPSEQTRVPLPSSNVVKGTEEKLQANQNDVNEGKAVPSASPISDSENFPPPSTEVMNGVTERTIHIGVRQWAWDPNTITAKEGELVRLIVHNADVKHGLAIPELDVNEDIPEDGAVITFKADKVGTFEFLCSVYCGEGHAGMQGKIIVK